MASIDEPERAFDDDGRGDGVDVAAGGAAASYLRTPTDEDVEHMIAAGHDGAPLVTDRPVEAVEGADAVHTDIWASMGQEEEADARHRAFEGFQVDDRVMTAAPSHAVFMHCLPAHRGEEVAASVADGPQSRIFPQAHNRLHAFRGLLRFLLEEGA